LSNPRKTVSGDTERLLKRSRREIKRDLKRRRLTRYPCKSRRGCQEIPEEVDKR
jgi:hypothetical protein